MIDSRKNSINRRDSAIADLAGSSCSYNNVDGTITEWVSTAPQPSEADIEAKVAEYKIEWEAQEYARDRAPAYPSVGDQLDMMMKDMKNGTTTHQEACEAVKAKYPKP